MFEWLIKKRKQAQRVEPHISNVPAWHLSAMARAATDRERLIAAGVTHAKWVHSGGEGCGSTENNALHRSLSGRRYSLKAGVKVKRKTLWPGEELGCRCIGVPEIDL